MCNEFTSICIETACIETACIETACIETTLYRNDREPVGRWLLVGVLLL